MASWSSCRAKANAAAASIIKARAPFDYSGRSVDFLDPDPAMTRAFQGVMPPVKQAQWLDLILKRPDLYLRVRLEDFRWVLAAPVIEWCLPAYVGADAPGTKMAEMDLPRRFTGADRQLDNYSSWFFGTPIYAHSTFVLLALVLAGLFLWRRDPADIAMAALQLAGVGFASSFLIISVSCDYRYMYFTDLAALSGLLYAAIDPPWRRRRL